MTIITAYKKCFYVFAITKKLMYCKEFIVFFAVIPVPGCHFAIMRQLDCGQHGDKPGILQNIYNKATAEDI